MMCAVSFGMSRRLLLSQGFLVRAAKPFLSSHGIRARFTSITGTGDDNMCPFKELGVPKSSLYSHVKKAFVKLALRHHPDTSTNKSDKETFFRIRLAFESIQADPQGRAILAKSHNKDKKGGVSSSTWTDDELSAWFERETGRALSFHMDDMTRKEVVRVSKTMSPGGLDRGGMWEMAAMLERRDKEKNTSTSDAAADPLLLPQGDSKRRRRK